MDQRDGASPDVDTPIDRAIAAYLEAITRGEPVDRSELLNAYPDSVDDLQQFFADHDCAMQVAGPWRSLSSGDLSESQRTDPVATGVDTFTYSEPTPTAGELPKADGRELGTFGDYVLLHEIARGGMGVVFKACQLSLNRIVAIKMIRHSRLASRDEIERFQQEAAAAAKLKHPHIIVIHEVGCVGEQHYFSMDYVEGRTLAELARNGPLPPKLAAQYIQQVAEAVHYAHTRHVLHRDLKPSNVLVDTSGRVHVMDFGLAKQIDQSHGLTFSGQIIGTPAYMAPEQIASRRGELGSACDVYGLGATLYELLTGQAPFRGGDQIETLLQVLECDPQSPHTINPHIPRHLELICLKCLEKDPQRRYATAQAVADDLARYLAGDSISVSSPSLVDRVVRTLERSQYDQDFRAWSWMLFYFAWISLATHTLVFLNRALELPTSFLWTLAIRLLEIAGLGVVLWFSRRHWYPIRGAPARQLWSLGLGYLAGAFVLLAVVYGLTPTGTAFDDFRVYPPTAVLASMIFIVLGSSYWGYLLRDWRWILAPGVRTAIFPAIGAASVRRRMGGQPGDIGLPPPAARLHPMKFCLFCRRRAKKVPFWALR